MVVVALCNLVLHFEMIGALSEHSEQPTPMIYSEDVIDTVIHTETDIRRDFDRFLNRIADKGMRYLLISAISLPVIYGLFL